MKHKRRGEMTDYSLTASFRCYFSQASCKCRHEINTVLAVFQSVWSAVSGKTVKAVLLSAQFLHAGHRWMEA